MLRLLHGNVMSETAARRLALGAGFLLLAACTTLVLKMLPEFTVWPSISLVACVALAWVVLGSQIPKLVRA